MDGTINGACIGCRLQLQPTQPGALACQAAFGTTCYPGSISINDPLLVPINSAMRKSTSPVTVAAPLTNGLIFYFLFYFLIVLVTCFFVKFSVDGIPRFNSDATSLICTVRIYLCFDSGKVRNNISSAGFFYPLTFPDSSIGLHSDLFSSKQETR